MQYFFLFWTMLIVASEAFQKEFDESEVSKRVSKQIFNFSPRDKHLMAVSDLNFPVKLVKSFGRVYYRKVVPSFIECLCWPRDYFMPGHKIDKVLKYPRKNLSCTCRYFFNEKRRRRKKKHKCFPFIQAAKFCTSNLPQYFGNDQLQSSRVRHNVLCHCFHSPNYIQHFNGKIRYKINYDKNVMKKNDQCVMCVYPSLNRKDFHQKKIKFLKLNRNDIKLSALKSWKRIKNRKLKNKRSASTSKSNDKLIFNEKQQKNTWGRSSENQDTRSQILKASNVKLIPSQRVPMRLNREVADKSKSSRFSQPSYPHDYDAIQPLVSIPKINFKYPYNPKLYESFIRGDNISLSPANKKIYRSEEKTKDVITETVPRDLAKLKQMLDETESVLKGESKGDEPTAEKSGKNIREETNSTTVITTLTDDAIKAKIDRVAIPILTQISAELGEKAKITNTTTNSTTSTTTNTTSTTMIKDSKTRKESKFMTGSNKKDRSCSPNGIWLSSAMGLEINVTTLPNLMLKVKVTSSKRNGIINKNWSMQGLTLSKIGGPLILAAVNPQKKKIASFIGQCKICQEEDIIFGTWTISGCAQRCTDMMTTVETKLDVFKRKKKRKS